MMPEAGSVAQRKLVLLVEDNVDALDIYGSSLRHAGFDVVEAPSIGDARSAVLAQRPDIVVLDCRLPDGDGLMLLERWRKSDARMKDVPVIVLTASVHRQDVDAALLAGADQFVPKPCPGNVLALHVERALDGSRPSARLRRVP
jgi:two-component system phosphate regulon response regulator PhoB